MVGVKYVSHWSIVTVPRGSCVHKMPSAVALASSSVSVAVTPVRATDDSPLVIVWGGPASTCGAVLVTASLVWSNYACVIRS